MSIVTRLKSPSGRRLTLITLDQALSGGSNMLTGVLAARMLGPEIFGLMTIVFQIYMTAQGAIRALVSQPLLVHPTEAEGRPGDAIGTALAIGVVFAAVVLVAGLAARHGDERLGNGLVVLAVALPLLSLQDVGRFLGFATWRPSLSLLLDVTWLGLLVGAAAGLVVGDARTLPIFVAAWAGAGSVAALLVLWQHRRTGRLRFDWAWLRQTWALAWRYLASFALSQGGAIAMSAALVATVGAEVLGAVRAAELLLSPCTMFNGAAGTSSVADISRMTGRDELRRQALRISALAAGMAVLNGIVVLSLPSSVGAFVLGDTWYAAQPLLVLATIRALLLGVTLGARAGLIGTRAIGKSLAIDLVFVPVLTCAAIFGALSNGGRGLYWGVVITVALALPIWWGVFRSHSGRFAEASSRAHTAAALSRSGQS